MIRNILGTIITRVITAALTLVIVLVNSYYLGAEKVGTIGLILLAVTLIQLLNNFVGGGAIVFLLPRSGVMQLIIPAYLWALLTSFAGSLALHLFNLIPQGYFIHVLVLSLILSLAMVNFQALLGKEKIRWFNVITVLQILALILVLFFFLFIRQYREVMAYVYALYASYSLAFLLTFSGILPFIRFSGMREGWGTVREIFRYGSVMQAGNIFQFMNYRLGYYFLEFFLGRAAVGVYSVGVQLAESIWLPGRSIAMVQYTRISNEKDKEYAARLTLTLVKISFLLAIVAIGVVFVLLWLFFPLLFKPEFNPVKIVMASLAFGILIFSVSLVLSPYFSGLGKPEHNTISSAIGLVLTVTFSWLLIPRMGIAGAGLTASISYTASTLYQFIMFMISTRFRMKDFLLTGQEIRQAVSEARKLMKPVKDTPG
jgi:O-antigen/teichoic acid export membrane protein